MVLTMNGHPVDEETGEINEEVFTKTGTCCFCHQQKTMEFAHDVSQREVDEAVSESCGCDASRHYKGWKMRIANTKANAAKQLKNEDAKRRDFILWFIESILQEETPSFRSINFGWQNKRFTLSVNDTDNGIKIKTTLIETNKDNREA